jgi:hypothetical protein
VRQEAFVECGHAPASDGERNKRMKTQPHDEMIKSQTLLFHISSSHVDMRAIHMEFEHVFLSGIHYTDDENPKNDNSFAIFLM